MHRESERKFDRQLIKSTDTKYEQHHTTLTEFEVTFSKETQNTIFCIKLGNLYTEGTTNNFFFFKCM